MYSDGWLEQGGYIYGDGGTSGFTISLYKNYIDTNYIITQAGGQLYVWMVVDSSNKYTYSFRCYTVNQSGQGYNRNFYWKTEGYAA